MRCPQLCDRRMDGRTDVTTVFSVCTTVSSTSTSTFSIWYLNMMLTISYMRRDVTRHDTDTTQLIVAQDVKKIIDISGNYGIPISNVIAISNTVQLVIFYPVVFVSCISLFSVARRVGENHLTCERFSFGERRTSIEGY